jgi:hypothetical protein
MIAITVSTNYEDLLDIILPQNARFFDKWYIITREDDAKTLAVIRKHNKPNVEVVFYNFFRDIPKPPIHVFGHRRRRLRTIKSKFDKGGAIRYCQEILTGQGYNGNVLILDSDIYLPDNFSDIISRVSIKSDILYGTNQRNDFYSYDNFITNKIDYAYAYSKQCHGYFQLYKHAPTLLYKNSMNCSTCDIEFHTLFSSLTYIMDLDVAHLGKAEVNWDMRLTHGDFTPHLTTT